MICFSSIWITSTPRKVAIVRKSQQYFSFSNFFLSYMKCMINLKYGANICVNVASACRETQKLQSSNQWRAAHFAHFVALLSLRRFNVCVLVVNAAFMAWNVVGFFGGFFFCCCCFGFCFFAFLEDAGTICRIQIYTWFDFSAFELDWISPLTLPLCFILLF